MGFYKQTKRLLLLLTMLSAEGFADAQIKVETSETVELMSIISRTAGFREYCMDNGGQYTSDTETWFSTYGQHRCIYQRTAEKLWHILRCRNVDGRPSRH